MGSRITCISMQINFVKLHGNGNDFILIDEFNQALIPDEMKSQFAELYCDRKLGIGGDGILFLKKGSGANLKMQIFQPDGSEAEMCGNGVRCLVKYAYDSGYVQNSCNVETIGGPIPVTMENDEDGDFIADVAMGSPLFDSPSIPAKGSGDFHEIISGYEVYAVNTGVPHAIVFLKDIEMVDLYKLAPQIRHSQFFPKGANVNLVEVTGKDSLKIRTFERGVEGETLSCGTGATAAAAVAHRLLKTGPVVEVETAGGPLTITLTDRTRMKGPADTVFTGVLNL